MQKNEPEKKLDCNDEDDDKRTTTFAHGLFTILY
jgi:hypothetical protein